MKMPCPTRGDVIIEVILRLVAKGGQDAHPTRGDVIIQVILSLVAKGGQDAHPTREGM
jgi:hypothetical protein